MIHNCDFCNKSMTVKPSRLKRSKTVCCSLECSNKLRSITFKGENNHQFGLKGDLNASFKKELDRKINYYGYILIRGHNHPFSYQGGWYPEHRIVAEQFLIMDENNSIEINGKRYLKSDYEVHHKNEDKQDNRPENLEIFFKGEHVAHHNTESPVKRDEVTGRFIGGK